MFIELLGKFYGHGNTASVISHMVIIPRFNFSNDLNSEGLVNKAQGPIIKKWSSQKNSLLQKEYDVLSGI